MFKHATISRTSKVQQTLQLHNLNNWPLNPSTHQYQQQVLAKAQQPSTANCKPVLWPPTSSLQQSDWPIIDQASSTNLQNNHASSSNGADSIIKVFAQSLSQDVEYVTLHVNSQTKSEQIIKSLLKKFRLKHRDPNLFYLTLERWIRKDGLKFKSVMLLGDEASPLQLQQCCSNPPHNDIKFTLQMRAGALVKIYCSDVAPDAKYKCLSLSAHTTVQETIELMLHCLNLAHQVMPTSSGPPSHNQRQSNSPGSTNSSASSSCSTSSGIDSDSVPAQHRLKISVDAGTLDTDSRTSSSASILSTSNISTISNTITDQYCLMVECKNNSHQRVLESDEYLVDIYQSLVQEADGNQHSSNEFPLASQQQSSDHWFFIKMKRCNECGPVDNNLSLLQPAINFVNPRLNVPLPPIPVPLVEHSNYNNNNNYYCNNGLMVQSLQNVVSTTQIEINSRPHNSSLIGNGNVATRSTSIDHTTSSNGISTRMPPPPKIISLPPIMPRRRNLSNVSSTFGRPLVGTSSRRRYDPAQLAEDLSKLDVARNIEPCS